MINPALSNTKALFMFSNYEELSGQSRVWVYQSNRIFTDKEIEELDDLIRDFITSWTAHNQVLKGFGKTYHHRFIALMVDETANNASGCSIDKSLHFIQELQKRYNLNLLDRLAVAYIVDDQIKVDQKDNFIEKVGMGHLGLDTPIFNNLVSTKEAFENEWKVPASKSWLARFIKLEA